MIGDPSLARRFQFLQWTYGGGVGYTVLLCSWLASPGVEQHASTCSKPEMKSLKFVSWPFPLSISLAECGPAAPPATLNATRG